MVEIIKQNKPLFIVLAIVIVLFIAYGASDKAPAGALIQKQSAASSSSAEREILQLLKDVQSIKLDGSVFQDPAFASLRDFGRRIIQEPTGKVNPFLQSEISTTTQTVVPE